MFDLLPYTFLQTKRDNVTGATIVTEFNAEGVFKLRTGMSVNETREDKPTTATLHVRPNEAFITSPDNREFYRLTLQQREYVS